MRSSKLRKLAIVCVLIMELHCDQRKSEKVLSFGLIHRLRIRCVRSLMDITHAVFMRFVFSFSGKMWAFLSETALHNSRFASVVSCSLSFWLTLTDKIAVPDALLKEAEQGGALSSVEILFIARLLSDEVLDALMQLKGNQTYLL